MITTLTFGSVLFLTSLRLLLLRLPDPLGFYIFLIWVGFTFLAAFLAFLVVLPGFLAIGKPHLIGYIFLQTWWCLVRLVWNVTINIEGIENLQGHGGPRNRAGSRPACVMVANHQSELDFLLGGMVLSQNPINSVHL